MKDEIVVVSCGGSIINPGKPDVKTIMMLAEIFNDFDGKLLITTGGGTYARIYADAVRELSENEFFADEVAILETKQNAMLLGSAIKDASPVVPESFREAVSLLKNYKVVLMGGTIPGITTDADAVMMAEVSGAKRVINISNTQGLYDKDPKIAGAKKLSEVTLQQLVDLAFSSDTRKAGGHFIFDMLACKLALRAGIEVHFIPAKKADIENALRGKKHSGSVARP